MNLQEIAKMARRWPEETPSIIGAVHETRRAKLQQARREQRPFTVPRKKDHYGSEVPVKPILARIASAIKQQWADKKNREEAILTLAVCAIFALAILVFVLSVPGAIEEAQIVSRHIVAESQN